MAASQEAATVVVVTEATMAVAKRVAAPWEEAMAAEARVAARAAATAMQEETKEAPGKKYHHNHKRVAKLRPRQCSHSEDRPACRRFLFQRLRERPGLPS